MKSLAAPLFFFLFTFLTALLVVHFVIKERQSKRSMESLQVGMDLVSERLAHMKQRLAMDLSAELIRRKNSDTGANPLLGFSMVGILQSKNGSLHVDWLSFKDDAEKLKPMVVDAWVRDIDPDELKERGSQFFVANAAGRDPYMISVLPFQLGESQAPVWGISVETLPSRWLDFPRSQSLWIVEDTSQMALASAGGQYQGVGFKDKLKNLSESVAHHQSRNGEEWSWQKLKGSNLVVLWREASASWFALSLWWLVFGMLFALGLIPFVKIQRQLHTEPFAPAEPTAPAPVQARAEKPLGAVEAARLPDLDFLGAEEEEDILEPIAELKVPRIELTPPPAVSDDSEFNAMINDAVQNQNAAIQSQNVRVNLLLEKGLKTSWPLSQLQSALEEILKNSVEAMESADTKTLTITANQKGSEIELCVEDTGSGMTDEILARSAEAFFSTKPSGSRRRGLGLNVAKRLLEISGGKLRIETMPAIGTKIYFDIPNTPVEDAKVQARTAEAPATVRKPRLRI